MVPSMSQKDLHPTKNNDRSCQNKKRSIAAISTVSGSRMMHQRDAYDCSPHPSRCDGEQCQVKCTKKSVELFPVKLRRLLDDAERENNQNIISWLPGGMAFKIHNQEAFTNFLLQRYFRQSKFKSFTRQLYLYGFGKIDIGNGNGAFCHPQFRRDDVDACLSIDRQNARSHINAMSNSTNSAQLLLPIHPQYGGSSPPCGHYPKEVRPGKEAQEQSRWPTNTAFNGLPPTAVAPARAPASFLANTFNDALLRKSTSIDSLLFEEEDDRVDNIPLVEQGMDIEGGEASSGNDWLTSFEGLVSNAETEDRVESLVRPVSLPEMLEPRALEEMICSPETSLSCRLPKSTHRLAQYPDPFGQETF